MRCKNCGWPNEAGITRCIKCNAPLQGSMIDSSPQQSAPSSSDEAESLKATLREPSSGGAKSFGNSSNVCPKCGYPVSSSSEECPICHNRLNPDKKDNDSRKKSPKNTGGFSYGGGTINPWATPSAESFCTLCRIPWQNENVTYEPVSYSGRSIILNRANTDNNNSITSREQAVITYENGGWFIENKSDLKTTLLRVDRKIKLEDGDVIVLGNRMFKFKKG